MAQDTWDGGAGSGLWSANDNWLDNTAPVPATAGVLTFSGGDQTTMNNDLTGVTVTSLSFTNNGVSNTATFTLAGNRITLTTQNNAVATTAIAGGGTAITDTLSANLEREGISQFNIGLDHDLIFSGAYQNVSGKVAALSKGGNGTLTVSGANTYTGLTYVDAGILKLGNNNVLSSNTLEIKRANQANNLNSNPILDLNGYSDTIGGITLGNNAPTLTGAGANLGEQTSIIDTGATKGLLTLGGGISYRAGSGGAGNVNGQATISANLATGNANRTLFIGDGVAAEDLVISGAISGSGILTKLGVGTLMLSGANTHTGNLNIETGTVKLGASGVLPDANIVQLGVNSSITGVTFDINGNSETIGALRLGGAGGLNNPAAAGLTHSIVNTGLSTAVLTLGSTFNYYSGVANQNGQVTISANINTGNAARNLTVEDSTLAAVDVLISGAIVGAGNGFNKAGAGTLEITSNSNTYTGNTTVGAGTLVINGNISTSALTTVNSGGTLSGTGTVGKASVAVGGILAPGNSIGTLNFSDTLNLAGISNFEIDPLLALGLNADRANVTNGLTYGGTLNVLYSGSSTNFASGMVFNLFDASTFTGSFATLNLPSLSDGLTWQNDLATNGSLSVIPEPNSAMLLGALGVLGALRRRRA